MQELLKCSNISSVKKLENPKVIYVVTYFNTQQASDVVLRYESEKEMIDIVNTLENLGKTYNVYQAVEINVVSRLKINNQREASY